MHEPGSLAHLERAMQMVNLRIDHVRLLVVTHAHADHFGQALPIVERSGCDLWMQPELRSRARVRARTPTAPSGAASRSRARAACPASPSTPTPSGARNRARASPAGSSRPATPSRASASTTDHGEWRILETPGHAPSHVCIHLAERRVLLSGDHLLGRVSLYYDYGWTPDPAGEFLASLEKVDALDARLCLSGHGRPFTDVRAHVRANQKLVADRAGARRARPQRRRAPHRLRDHPRGLRHPAHRGDGRVVAGRDPVLPHAPPTRGAGAAVGRGAGALAGRVMNGRSTSW